MSTLEEIKQKIEPYERERILMNVQQFDQLLKRVNIEDNNEVKTRILTVIEKYLDTLSVQDVVVADATAPELSVENVEEVVVENVEKVEPQAVEAISIEETRPEPANVVVQEAEESEEEPSVVAKTLVTVTNEEEQLSVDLPGGVTTSSEDEVQMNQDQAVQEVEKQHEEAATEYAEQLLAKNEEEAKEPVQVTAPVEEPVEQPAVEAQVDDTEYVETFSLIAPTNDKHLDTIIERGGVMFRDKRTFMLMLSLEDEIVAIAKSIKLEQFPEEVQKHLKDGGYVTVQVVAFGEITKKSRARYTDVTFKNLQLLENDHWIVKNVTNLLEKGEVPEHVKEKEVADTLKKIEETATTEPVVETPAVEEEKPFLMTSFLIHPNFVPAFTNQKEDILKGQYGIVSADGVAKFITKNAKGTVVLGMDDKTALKPNNYVAKILDYTIKEQDGKTFIQFKLDANVVEPVQPAPVSESTPASIPVKANVQVTAKGEVPADFPLVDTITLPLYPKAQEMFKVEQAKAMIGKPLNLGMYHHAENGNRIGLMSDVFEMGSTTNPLSSETIRNSKWVARLTDVNVVDTEQGKSLVIKFDHLVEVEAFPSEKAKVLDVLDFAEITEESFVARQQELAQMRAQAKAAAETAQAKTVPAEQLLNKEVDPQEAKQLINPNPGADYQQGYQELVSSQSKDMGGAVQEIRNQTALTQEGRKEIMQQTQGVISGVITQTLKETGIHTQTEQKQATQVMGNLQEGSGNLSQTETVINFVTPYSPQSWAKSVGKQIKLSSQIQVGGGMPVKSVQMLGNNGVVVGQGQVEMNEALLMDGNQHEATLLNVESFQQQQQGFLVALRLGSFKKVA